MNFQEKIEIYKLCCKYCNKLSELKLIDPLDIPVKIIKKIQNKEIELFDYLIVDDAKALMNYIMSCHGNQKEYLGYRLKEFQAYLEKIIDENNGIKITKDCGLFICRK